PAAAPPPSPAPRQTPARSRTLVQPMSQKPDVPPPVPPTSPVGTLPKSHTGMGEVGALTPKAPVQPKAHESAAKRDWPAYFKAVEAKPARDPLLKALENFDKEDAGQPAGLVGTRNDPPPPPTTKQRLAIDLGCGSGRDTLELLRRAGGGWRVLATDATP